MHDILTILCKIMIPATILKIEHKFEFRVHPFIYDLLGIVFNNPANEVFYAFMDRTLPTVILPHFFLSLTLLASSLSPSRMHEKSNIYIL